LAVANPEERSVLRRLLLDLKMEVSGEAADWYTTLAEAPAGNIDRLVVDWDLLPDPPNAAIEELRQACPANLVIVLVSQLDVRAQAALSAGVDLFISRNETAELVVERLRTIAASLSVNNLTG